MKVPLPFNIEGFEEWLNRLKETECANYPVVYNIIPDEVIGNERNNTASAHQLKLQMISQACAGLLNELKAKYQEIRHVLSDSTMEEQEETMNSNNKFLNFLFNNGLLPTYAFPQDSK